MDISTPKSNNQFKQLFTDPDYDALKTTFCKKILTDLKFRHSPNCARRLISRLEKLISEEHTDNEIYDDLHNFVVNDLYKSTEYKNQLANTWSRAQNRADQIEEILSRLLKGKEINSYLDIGCNEGSITQSIGELTGAKKIIGVDVFEPKNPPSGVEFILLDKKNSYHLPFENESQDIISAFMSLHHIEKNHITLNEVHRLLKSEGIFLIREHDCTPPELSVLLDLMHGFYAMVWPEVREMDNFRKHYAHYITKTDLITLISSCGFELITETEPVGAWRYYYSLWKKIDIVGSKDEKFGVDVTKSEYRQFFFVANESKKYGYESKHLQIMRHQQLPKIYFDPSLGRTRLIINHSTGSGKTKTSILIAEEYIGHYKKIPSAPQVYVLNYNRDVYITTLMTVPDFGYVSAEEIVELEKLYKRQTATQLPDDYSAWRNYHLSIRNRITNRQIGGYYKFHGYLDFANKLGFNVDPPVINEIFLASLKYSLIVADEFQNIYNSEELNAAGKALQYALDHHGKNIYFIGLSATPITNSPTEVIDVIRIFTGKIVTENQLFTSARQLKPGAIELISNALANHVSYYYNVSSENYPDFEFMGEHIPGISFDGMSNVYDFKFVRCKAKGEYLRVLTEYGLDSDNMDLSDHVLRDMVLPGGIYNTLEAKVSMSDINSCLDDIENYSAKYPRLFADLPKMQGKILIYHNYVHSSGITFIEKGLRRKLGYISGRDAMEGTPCYLCGVALKAHNLKTNDKNDHDYHPTRYNMIHSELDDITKRNNFKYFNVPANNMGQDIKIQLGSHRIVTAYDYTQVSHLCVMSFPEDFSSLVQLVGRVIRNGAGVGMPAGWKVQIHIYVTADSLEENIYRRKYQIYIPVSQINNIFDHESFDRNMNTQLDSIKEKREESFFGYNFYKTEKILIERLITHAFQLAPQYTFDDLWAFVRDPPIRVDLNTAEFSSDLFIFILSEMMKLEKLQQYGEYYMLPLEPFNRIEHITIDINTIDIDNLIGTVKPRYNIFIQYPPAAHISVIRLLIANSSRNSTLYNFYRKCRIIESSKSYVDPSFKSVYIMQGNTFIEEFYKTEPRLHNVFGYYEAEQFKILDMKKRDHQYEDGRKMHRGLACKSIKIEDLERIASSLGINPHHSGVGTLCSDIEEVLIRKHMESKEKIYFGFLGNPL